MKRYRIKFIGQFSTQHYANPVVGPRWEAKYGKYNCIRFDPATYWSCKKLKTAEKMLDQILEHIEDKYKCGELTNGVDHWKDKLEIEAYKG